MPQSPNRSLDSILVYHVDNKKLLVVLQSAVVKVISDLPADKLSTDGVPFLISASVELAELLVRLSIFPFTGKYLLQYLQCLCT